MLRRIRNNIWAVPASGLAVEENREMHSMTYLQRARSGALGFATAAAITLATATLASCDSGPDRAKQAEAIKADVEQQLWVIEQEWAGGRLSHTALAVTPKEGTAEPSFLVTVDGMKLQPEPGAELASGQVTYSVTPKDEKTFAVSDLKLPPEIPFTGPGGSTGKLAMKVEAWDGVWSREFKTFLSFGSEVSDVVATDTSGGDIRIQSAKLIGDSSDKGDGVFDMTGSLVLAGTSIGDTEGGKLTLGELKVDGKYDSVKLKDYRAAATRIQALTAAQMAAAESGAAAPALTPEQQKQFSEQMMIIAKSIKGGDWKLGLSDLGFVEAGGAAQFTLKRLDLMGAMSGLDGDKAAVSFAIAHQGLAIAAPEANTPLARAVLPKEGKLAVKFTDVPSQALSKALADGLPGVIGGGQAAEAGLMALGFSLQSMLGTSGMKIAIEPSGWSGEVTRLDAEAPSTPMAPPSSASSARSTWRSMASTSCWRWPRPIRICPIASRCSAWVRCSRRWPTGKQGRTASLSTSSASISPSRARCWSTASRWACDLNALPGRPSPHPLAHLGRGNHPSALLGERSRGIEDPRGRGLVGMDAGSDPAMMVTSGSLPSAIRSPRLRDP
jgi:hypothetical protein